MRNFILKVVIFAVAIGLVAKLVPGIHILGDNLSTLLIIGFVFGVLNAFVKPIIKFLTCPLVLVTLGLFVLVINALMLLITAALIPARLQIDGFFPAFVGGIVMSIISMILERILGVGDNSPPRPDKPMPPDRLPNR
jgi:putative membrane protein